MPGDGTGGGAGAGTGGDGGDTSTRRGPRVVDRQDRQQRRRKRNYQQPTELVDRLIHQYGSRDRALEELAGENYDLREDRRELTEQLDQTKTKVPADGAVILVGPEAESWKKIKAFADEKKITPEKLGETLTERVKKADELEDKDTKSQRSAKRKAVAQAAGVNGDVLDPLLEQFGLEVETREIEIQDAAGKSLGKKPIAHVRKANDANAAWEKLSDLIARDGSPLKPFAVALATKASGTTATQGTQGTQQSPGITFPDQRGGGSGGEGTSIVDSFLKQDRARADRPNPLRPPTQSVTTKGDGAAA